VKECIKYKVVINDNEGKERWKEDKEEMDKTMTKEKIIKRLLIEINDKYKEQKMIIKLNYKKFVKEYDILRVKYDEIMKLEEDKINRDDSMIMKVNELVIHRDLIKIIDNIRLIE
jgi:hypothetical protein